jgi:hypothetical protein
LGLRAYVDEFAGQLGSATDGRFEAGIVFHVGGDGELEPGLIEEIRDRHLLDVEGLFRNRRDVGDFTDQHQKQQKMRGIDLPDPPQDTLRSGSP